MHNDLELWRLLLDASDRLENIDPPMAARLRAEARARSNRLPLVLSHHAGYWWIGDTESVVPVPDPDLAGLRDFATIVAHGRTVDSTLAAVDLVEPCRAPGAALRRRLSTAADWMAKRCPALAVEMRSPRLRVDDAGRITREPRPIVLDVFGMCSGSPLDG